MTSTKTVTPDSDEYEDEEFQNEEDDTETTVAKLKGKPKQNPKSLCGKGSNLVQMDLSKIPSADKMSIRRKSALDLLRCKIPIPKGAVPRTALPVWFEMPMYQKIPMLPVPSGYIYFSRGKLGNPLHRCHPFYNLWDHRNLERVVGAPYSALHDPYAKRYMSKPIIQRFLKTQGMINQTGEVLCSLKEFNKFRLYLCTQYNDELNLALSNGDLSWKWQREQLRSIIKSESNDEGRGAFVKTRRLAAKKILFEMSKAKLKRLERKQANQEKRLLEWHEEKRKDRLGRIMIGFQRAQLAAERRAWVEQNRIYYRKGVLQASTINEIENWQRRKDDLEMLRQASIRSQIDWIDKKLMQSSVRQDAVSQLDEAIRFDIAKKSRKRQRCVERYRAKIPEIIEKKKAEERRLWEVVRKFAMRWLDRVRRRLNAPKDLLHESCWIGKSKGVLDDTLKYLKEVSGYEKMDDFVLNIIKLKRQIQHQIEIEEAEEAAAAKALAEQEGASSAISDSEAEGSHGTDDFKDSLKSGVTSEEDAK